MNYEYNVLKLLLSFVILSLFLVFPDDLAIPTTLAQQVGAATGGDATGGDATGGEAPCYGNSCSYKAEC